MFNALQVSSYIWVLAETHAQLDIFLIHQTIYANNALFRIAQLVPVELVHVIIVMHQIDIISDLTIVNCARPVNY